MFGKRSDTGGAALKPLPKAQADTPEPEAKVTPTKEIRPNTGRNEPSEEYYETKATIFNACLLYTSPSPRDATLSRMPSSA